MKLISCAGALVLGGLFVLAAEPAGAASSKRMATTTLTANLTGAAERPGPGDPKGSGSVILYVQPVKDWVCYELSVKGVAATLAHLHQASPGESGPPLADLKPPGADGKSTGCFEAGPAMLEGLTTNPAAYYVNVHSAEYKSGALRGQLRAASRP